jgi:hypothetical protein
MVPDKHHNFIETSNSNYNSIPDGAHTVTFTPWDKVSLVITLIKALE